jgi:hypothetical protein
VTFYGDCVKLREDFALNFGDKKNRMLHHDNMPSVTELTNTKMLERPTP